MKNTALAIRRRPLSDTNETDFVVVKDAKLANGLLTIDLERQLPEAMKPRRITINGSTPPAETKRAA